MNGFPDVEAALVAFVMDVLVLPLEQVGTATPSSFSATPFVRVNRIGGTDDVITDTSTVMVDVFAPTRAVVLPAAERLRQALIDGPHLVGTTVIDKARTITGPVEAPWKDTSQVRRWSATYRVQARRSKDQPSS